MTPLKGSHDPKCSWPTTSRARYMHPILGSKGNSTLPREGINCRRPPRWLSAVLDWCTTEAVLDTKWLFVMLITRLSSFFVCMAAAVKSQYTQPQFPIRFVQKLFTRLVVDVHRMVSLFSRGSALVCIKLFCLLLSLDYCRCWPWPWEEVPPQSECILDIP